VRPNAQAFDCRKSNSGCWLLKCHVCPGVIGRPCLALIDPASQLVRRAADAASASVQNMSVTHRRADVAMAQELVVIPFGVLPNR
jgi:hypothetical protein